MLRKTSRLLAWRWSLLFGIGAIVCASKLAFVRQGRRYSRTGLHRFQRPLSALRRPSGLSSCGCLARVFRGLAKSSRRHRLYSGRCGGVIHGWSSMRIPSRSDRWPAARRCWQRFVPVAAKRTTHSESVSISWGGVAMPGDGPAYPVA